VPTERGLSVFVNQLLAVRELGPWEKRSLEDSLEEGGPTPLADVASRLLSERTRQLGFVVAPRLDALVLRHVSFVRVSSERVLAVLISEGGRAFQRVLEEPGHGDQAQLDRFAASLNERIAGETLRSVRDRLIREASALRGQAERLLERVLRLGGDAALEAVDVVVASRLALLQHPELRDPERLRVLLQTVEEKERLIALVERLAERPGACVLFGHEVPEPDLHHCALVAVPFGPRETPLGTLGVIGPNRMDFARVIPVVSYLSRLLTEHLEA
jgi:heat-inducible transcriptional repressor